MPCYLFTYHAYGSWLPNRPQGYVKRGQGIMPSDLQMHRRYVDAMKETAVRFDDGQQRLAVAAVLQSEPLQQFEAYFTATDVTHIHTLLGWRDQRAAVKLRSLLKNSLSRAFNRALGRRTWFAEGGSRRQVKSRGHFEYLMSTYLPNHAGWKWSRQEGMYR